MGFRSRKGARGLGAAVSPPSDLQGAIGPCCKSQALQLPFKLLGGLRTQRGRPVHWLPWLLEDDDVMLVDDPAGHGHTTSNPAAGLVETAQQPEVPEGADRAAEGQQPPARRPTAQTPPPQAGSPGPSVALQAPWRPQDATGPTSSLAAVASRRR